MLDSKQWLSIRASAGSGKTFSLTSRFIYLLFSGAKVGEILALTFTIKAKEEMQERILKTLRELLELNDNFNSNPYVISLCELGLSVDYLKQHIKRVYFEFLHSKNHIMTFDSFFSMVIKKFSFYVGLLSDYEISANCDYSKEALIKTLKNMNNKNLKDFTYFLHLHNLKTKNILELLEQIKIDDFVLDKVDYDMQWKQKIIDAYSELRAYVLEITEHKHIINRLSVEIDMGSSIKDFLLLFKNNELIFTEKMIAKLVNLNADEAYLSAKLEIIKSAFYQYFKSREYNILSTILNLYKEYNKNKSLIISFNNKLGFDDLSAFCFELLNHHIDREFFYFRLDSKINHILVDEFQDTNIKQYLILKPLIDEIKSGIGKDTFSISKRSLFFVGDEKQSIYRFRGSDSKLFNSISKSLNMEINSLDKNYRSAKNIVNFVNDIFKDKFENYKSQIPNKQLGGYVKVETKSSKDEILESIKDRVLFLIENNRKDIMILTRKNSTAVEVRNYLNKHIDGIKIALQLKGNTNTDFLSLLNALKYIDSKELFYLKNAIKLNGSNFFDEINLDISSSTNPSDIVLYLMEKLHIYSKIALFILETSLLYDSLSDFISDLEMMDIDIDEDKKYDIKISNIHKSKGLEFEDVIIAEYGRESNEHDLFYYNYDGLLLRQISYMANYKERSLVDSDFCTINEKCNKEVSLDSLNLLYVAFTRAKESLYIIKLNSHNFFNHIQIDDCEIGDDIQANPIPQPISKFEPNMINQESFGKQDDFIVDSTLNNNKIAQIKGMALHLAMEYALKYNDFTNIRDILINRYGLLLELSHIDTILENSKKILNNKIFKDLLSLRPRIECELSYLDSTKTIHRIDCLFIFEDSVYLFDYKSSALNIDEKKEQLRSYMNFARDYFKDKKIFGYLCFADGGISMV